MLKGSQNGSAFFQNIAEALFGASRKAGVHHMDPKFVVAGADYVRRCKVFVPRPTKVTGLKEGGMRTGQPVFYSKIMSHMESLKLYVLLAEILMF
jgi:hypothetical protein